jgi:hypothetical protein
MAGEGGPAAERLRTYLRELKPGARAALIAELERGLLHGNGLAGAEIVLAELRRSLRDNKSKFARFDDPARLFFQPIEPFLVDDGPDHKHRARITRSALEPVWLWISNTLMPAEVKAYAAQVDEALLAGDTEQAEQHARAFQDRVVECLGAMLGSGGDKDLRRLSVQLGTARAVEDVQTLHGILKARDGLAMLGTQLPGHIASVSGPVLESIKANIDASVSKQTDLLVYSLVLVMSRLAAPWQLIRLATKAAGGDAAKRIAETPYAVAVNIVLEEVDRRVRELAADLKSGRGIAVSALLKEVHDALRGLRSEIDSSPESDWGKQLTAVRAEVSKLLSAVIVLTPGRVRRLVRPRPSKEIAPGSKLDADEVAEVEALVGFVVTCRNYASELAINEVTQRTFNDVQQFLDTGTRTLLDSLRSASPAERPFRHSQLAAAVRFCAKVFGQEYASLLVKAAEVASHDHVRKVVAAAGAKA